MKVKMIHMQNFKRFADLTIQDIPETAKLVVLLGPNGSGKSSLFDAMHAKAGLFHYGVNEDPSYYFRSDRPNQRVQAHVKNMQLEMHQNPDQEAWKKAVYVRSAYRNEASFALKQLSAVGSALNERPINKMVDNDSRVSRNYQRLASTTMSGIFAASNADMTVKEYAERKIGEIRDVVKELFPNLILNNLANPLDGKATFRFSKGAAKGYTYENLSGGEKAAFDLILDMVIKVKVYDDTVFCIDEPENHVGMSLHGKLLRVLYDLVPENCQLWIATHSIGMMRMAYSIQKEHAEGKVVFLDFGCNFDEKQKLVPVNMDKARWQKMHEVIMGDLSELASPEKLCLCESDSGFDAKCYDAIFKENLPNVQFVSVGTAKRVVQLGRILMTKIPGMQVIPVRDKDDLTDAKVRELRDQRIRVLERKCIEHYLLDDEVLQRLHEQKFPDKESVLHEIMSIKGDSSSDLKGATEQIRRKLHKRGIAGIGETGEEFMQNVLAPIIKPPMRVYYELERVIFGEAR